MVLVELVIITVTLIVLIAIRIKWGHQYWKQKGVPCINPTFPFGNLGNLMNRKQHLSIVIQNKYNELKRIGEKHGGLFSFASPIYLPIDPFILKNIMQKDFNYFSDRGFYYNERDDPLSAHLFAISGSKWRNLRTKLTPTFTSGKMKMMFDTLVVCGDNMLEAMSRYEDQADGIDIKDVLARYTTDVIGSCAFGLECNSFKNEHSDFRKHGSSIFKRSSQFRSLLSALAFAYPVIAKKVHFKVVPEAASTFFLRVINDTLNYREENNVKRNDMLQLLIDLKDVASEDPQRAHEGQALSTNEIAAQAFVFFIAGFETSSTTMAFCLYELAQNQEVQEKLRDEIRIKNGGKLTYETIMNMKYMGQVIEETLRKYPPIAFLTRKCVEDYKVHETNVTIDKGTRVFIPVLALHHDPDYFPNPEKFDPERFSDENRGTIQPFTYIPFGEGPRLCIGMRFGLMQTKVGLTLLLKNYRISLNKRTVLPLNMDRFSFTLSAKEGIWLDIKKIN